MTHRSVADWQALNTSVVDQFRANGGAVGGDLEGHKLVLLTTTGARTGLPRMVVLVYFVIDGQMIVVGSKGGAPKHPDWVTNIRAAPRARAEVAEGSFDVIARELPETIREQTYRRIVEREPRFGVYRSMTSAIRTIPLFELQRV